MQRQKFEALVQVERSDRCSLQQENLNQTQVQDGSDRTVEKMIALYHAECWPAIRLLKKLLYVVEMKQLQQCRMINLIIMYTLTYSLTRITNIISS